MLPHRHNLTIVARLVIGLCFVTLCDSQVFASEKPRFVMLKIHGDDGAVAQYRAYPESEVKLLFPTGEAVLEPDASSEKWRAPSADILKKIHTAKVFDLKRRFNVVGVAFGDELFIFDEVFAGENSVAMSQLMRVTGAAPQNGAAALDLVKFYLALAHYRLEDPARFMAHKNSESEKKHAAENTRSFADMIGLSHSPEAVRVGATYRVDFFTYDAPGVSEKISHWKIDVGAESLKERLSEHHVGFHERYSKGSSETTRSKGQIHFSVAMMGDGFTEDGAKTDIQFWEASDGPGVGRTHYYYKSHEAAEKRMQEVLEKAIATIETRPWLDSDGKTVGTEALVIRINDDKKMLYASQLFEDETSVLELSCVSLGNLMAVQGRDLQDTQQ
jgi:hypothetical protein